MGKSTMMNVGLLVVWSRIVVNAIRNTSTFIILFVIFSALNVKKMKYSSSSILSSNATLVETSRAPKCEFFLGKFMGQISENKYKLKKIFHHISLWWPLNRRGKKKSWFVIWWMGWDECSFVKAEHSESLSLSFV